MLSAELTAEPASPRLEPRMADDDRKKRQDPGGPGRQDPGGQDPGGPGTSVITKTKPQTKRPSMYRVLLLNDDYTPMEFVVHVLERFFNKDREAATQIMHDEGYAAATSRRVEADAHTSTTSPEWR